MNKKVSFVFSSLFVGAFLCLPVTGQDDFNFSFENGVKPGAEAKKDESDPLEDLLDTEIQNEDFAFGFEGKKKQQRPPVAPVKEPAPENAEEPVAKDAERPAPGRPSEYQSLLEENLRLRGEIKQSAQSQQEAKRKNDLMVRQMADLEQRMVQSASLIQDLQKTKGSGSKQDIQNLLELEKMLKNAEKEKARLSGQLGTLRTQINAMSAPGAEAKIPVARRPAAPSFSPKPGTDLFKRLEEENAALKNKLVDIETARIQSEKAREKMAQSSGKAESQVNSFESEIKELRNKLSEAQADQKVREQLIKEVPMLEEQLVSLTSKTTEQNMVLAARSREVRELKNELEMREERLEKVRRMQKHLETSREKVKSKSDSEKRDMHYNMAVVYAEKGLYESAEKEYLRALRLDPADADIHYNLGILYDDALNDKRRALLHYKRYIKHNPYGSDIDAVRDWIRLLEMK